MSLELRGYLPYLAEIHSIVSKKKKLIVVKFTASDSGRWFSDINTVVHVASFKVESFWSKSRSRPHRVYLN